MNNPKKTYSAVGYLEPSKEGSLLALANTNGTVSIWNLKNGQVLREFKTIVSWGGRRLAYSEKKSRVLAGAWTRYGISCYDTANGLVLWNRKDLKHVQNITFSADDNLVYCGFEEKAFHVLNLEDGETVNKIRATREIYVDSETSTELHEYYGELKYVVDGQVSFKVQGESFAILDTSFGKDLFAISDVGKSVRVLSREDGNEFYRFLPPKESHVLRLSKFFNDESFYAILRPLTGDIQEIILKIRPKDNSFVEIGRLKWQREIEFCLQGTHLITSDGELIDCRNGKAIRKFEFPVKELETQ